MAKTNGSGQATTLAPNQLEALLDAAPTPAHRFLWAVMRFTGSRVSETLRLSWGAIQMTGSCLLPRPPRPGPPGNRDSHHG
jgi:integrase